MGILNSDAKEFYEGDKKPFIIMGEMKLKKSSFISAIIFFSLYLLNNVISCFFIFRNIDFMEVYICGIFIGILQSLYFLLKLSKRRFYFFFPFYYTLCCVLCVFAFQFMSSLIFTHEINLKLIFASLFHNILVAESFLFPAVVVSYLEEVSLFKILRKNNETFP